MMNKKIIFTICLLCKGIIPSPVSIENGGIGKPTINPYGLLVTNATGTGYEFLASTGTAAQGLISTGTSSLPTWQNVILGYTAGTGFMYFGSSTTAAASPNRTIIVQTTPPASITSSAVDNIAYGHNALSAMNTNSLCIAIGSGALQNATGSNNIAVGYNAGNAITTGTNNIALGALALASNQTGDNNIAAGYTALQNSTVSNLVGIGYEALKTNTIGTGNVAVGYQALKTNLSGNNNTAVGSQALTSNSTGSDNTALGFQALTNATGSYNVAFGYTAGSTLTTGSNNIYLGYNAQPISVTESNNLVIGNSSHTTALMFGITGRTSTAGTMLLVNSSGLIGTILSSEEYKKNIKNIDEQTVENLNNLKVKSFQYINDSSEEIQYGMIAEETAPIFPETILRDKEDKIDAIQYHKFTSLIIAQAQKQKQNIDTLEVELLAIEKKFQSNKNIKRAES